jgi:cell division protein FtsI (penicillin-binding protein 3)
MVLLGVGLIASLWLSTTAAADSYRLDTARQSTRALSERIEIVHSQIAAMQSAPALARAARSLGMVQQTEVARLVVAPDGQVTVFGTPKAAVAPAPPAPAVIPVVPPSGQPAAQPGQPVQQPGQGAQPAQPGQGAQPAQPGQGAQPAQPGQGAQPAQPGQAGRPGQPGLTVVPVQPGQQPSDVVRAGQVRPEHVP